jgi:hypothetical protein
MVSTSEGFQQGMHSSPKENLRILSNSFAQTAIPFLIGTKYDIFATFPPDEQEEITKQVGVLFFIPPSLN